MASHSTENQNNVTELRITALSNAGAVTLVSTPKLHISMLGSQLHIIPNLHKHQLEKSMVYWYIHGEKATEIVEIFV